MTNENISNSSFSNFLNDFIRFEGEGLISLESIAKQLSSDSTVVEETPPELYLKVLLTEDELDPKIALRVLNDCKEALYFQQACLRSMLEESIQRDLLLNRFASSMLAFALASDTTDELSYCLSPMLEIAYFANKNNIIDSEYWDELFRYAYSNK
jgi:hypothetical protein